MSPSFWCPRCLLDWSDNGFESDSRMSWSGYWRLVFDGWLCDLLRDKAEHQGEQMTPYSFRHRFAKQAHAARLAVTEIAEAMGHTIDAHLKSYARFKPDVTAANFAAINAWSLSNRFDRGRSFVRCVWPASPMVKPPTENHDRRIRSCLAPVNVRADHGDYFAAIFIVLVGRVIAKEWSLLRIKSVQKRCITVKALTFLLVGCWAWLFALWPIFWSMRFRLICDSRASLNTV